MGRPLPRTGAQRLERSRALRTRLRQPDRKPVPRGAPRRSEARSAGAARALSRWPSHRHDDHLPNASWSIRLQDRFRRGIRPLLAGSAAAAGDSEPAGPGRCALVRQLRDCGSPPGRPVLARAPRDRTDLCGHRWADPPCEFRGHCPGRKGRAPVNMQTPPPASTARVFGEESRRLFAASYPEAPQKVRHNLPDSPLLNLEAIAALAESLPTSSVHYNCGSLSIGGEGERQSAAGSIGEAIREVGTSGSWAVIKNIEQAPEYAALLSDMLAELGPLIEPKTGKVLHPEGWIFVSSPGAVTPFHFDPEHNVLMQLGGEKEMTVFPAGDPRFASDPAHEDFHTTGAYELRWEEALAAHGQAFVLAPG